MQATAGSHFTASPSSRLLYGEKHSENQKFK